MLKGEDAKRRKDALCQLEEWASTSPHQYLAYCIKCTRLGLNKICTQAESQSFPAAEYEREGTALPRPHGVYATSPGSRPSGPIRREREGNFLKGRKGWAGGAKNGTGLPRAHEVGATFRGWRPSGPIMFNDLPVLLG